MRSLTVQELYDYLSSPEFQRVDNDIFYNYYIYQYPAADEYRMRRQVCEFKQRLERPASYVNAMLLDMFDTFCSYLRSERFGDKTLLDDTLDEDRLQPDMATRELTTEANSDSFIHYVNRCIEAHLAQNDGLHKPYIFVYGMGKMFPYLRTNALLTKYERYNDTSRYKIILFYPGQQQGNSFSLFGLLPDTHTYRATLLINN